MTPGPARPLVSVIVPTYRRVEYLRYALTSAVHQTYPNLEIIVSDDSASDEIRAVVESFADPRVRYRHNGSSVGPTANSLAAYREARGVYVGTLHDDDAWESTFLDRLVPPLEADPDLVLAFSDHWIMDSSGQLQPEWTETNTRRWRRHLLNEGVYRPFYHIALVDRAVPMVMATVFRRTVMAWDDFPEPMHPLYDLWMSYLASRTGRGAYYCPERLTRYRVHGGAATARIRHDEAVAFCYSVFQQDPALASIRPGLKHTAASFHTSIGFARLSERRIREARGHLLYGLVHRPNVRSLVGLAVSYLPGETANHIARLRSVHQWLRAGDLPQLR